MEFTLRILMKVWKPLTAVKRGQIKNRHSLYLSLSLSRYLSLSISLSFFSTSLSFFLSIYLSLSLSFFLLSIYLSSFLPIANAHTWNFPLHTQNTPTFSSGALFPTTSAPPGACLAAQYPTKTGSATYKQGEGRRRAIRGKKRQIKKKKKRQMMLCYFVVVSFFFSNIAYFFPQSHIHFLVNPVLTESYSIQSRLPLPLPRPRFPAYPHEDVVHAVDVHMLHTAASHVGYNPVGLKLEQQ